MTVLPVKQVGSLLYSNQLQEEKNDIDDNQNVTVVKFMAKDFILHQDEFKVPDCPSQLLVLLHFHVYHGLLLCPPIAIHCPPPNGVIV